MTGRRLYEIVTDALHAERAMQRSSYYGDTAHNRNSFQFELAVGSREKDGKPEVVMVPTAPPAWGFLPQYEKDTWNAAARRISPRKR